MWILGKPKKSNSAADKVSSCVNDLFPISVAILTSILYGGTSLLLEMTSVDSLGLFLLLFLVGVVDAGKGAIRFDNIVDVLVDVACGAGSPGVW